ncbi:glycosyltransferase family 2 protein [Christiangramia sp. SM2212]|uniref:Glycosyltransferase family 2 protein n=1 Tax=Christiangramia sediminicola TaxID=3073267 RepID=A0ABU1EMX9_9FLAO|nr:glycosyltransferase family 2 protein [Christiangramia sp. SM2212]MDR5589701.1 glycosyltransferase family 2 protein [Christiangramia sp. SM2212]
MQPLISIIIPTYNRSQVLGGAVDSLLLQSYENWECLIVDDGSTDYTEELVDFYIQKDSRIKYLVRRTNPKGASHCRNVGLEKANGKYLMFLDSDDQLFSYALSNRLDILRKSPGSDFYIFPMYMKNNNLMRRMSIKPEDYKGEYLKKFLTNNISWGIMCVLWDVNFIRKLNGFKVDYPRLNDPELHIRALLKYDNYTLAHDQMPDSIYRVNNPNFRDRFLIADNYIKSLLLFIPDIAEELEDNNMHECIPLLRNYLKHFFSLHYAEVTRVDLLKLLKVSRNSGVITGKEYWKLNAILNLILVYNKLLRRHRNILANSLE